MTVDPRTPCLIGAAQRTVHPGTGPSPEPLELWADVARRAAEDALPGGGSRVLQSAESLQVVYCMSWPYDAPADRLAAALGIEPGHRLYSGIGGTTPQVLVQDLATAMLQGDVDLGIVVGAEALETKRQAKKAGERLDWSFRDPSPPPFPFEAPFHPAEVAHQVFQAWLTFPVFDIARRARLGTDPSAYVREVGELLAPFSDVATENPYAWFRIRRSAEELATPTADNRMVGYPYTKWAVSIMDVDMAAGLVLATHARADELGIPADRRTYLRGWSYATDPVYLAEHPDLASSPGMSSGASDALACAGVGIDDVAHLDLYSCFASSVHLACDALGIDRTDGRSLTVTGGLPFAGGAGSNYMLHSIATMLDVLRDDAGAVGMVSGVGMHMTKHAFGLYSTSPPPGGCVQPPRPAPAPDTVPIVGAFTGNASVASYTVAHGRHGGPEWGLVLADLPDGRRTYGRVEQPDLLHALEAEEWVGRTVHLREGERGVNLVTA